MSTRPFEGRLVVLREREPEDAARYFRWLNDPEVIPGVEVRYPQSLQAQRRRSETQLASGFSHARFAIETKDGGETIGGCSLRGGPPEDGNAELGIVVGERQFWDGGYGTDAMRTLCRFGFEMMNLHRIELSVFADNPRAIRCYEKVGFTHEGRLREYGFWRGRYRDLLYMSLLRGELS